MNRLVQCIISVFYLFSFNLVIAQPIDSLLLRTVENNPTLKALHLKYQTKIEAANQVDQLPNPQVGIGVPSLRPETRLGPQVMMVSAQQMFPWFGTLEAKKEVFISMSKEQFEVFSAEKLNLFYQVKSSYYTLAFLNKKKLILHEQLELFKVLENIALSKVESGQSTMADALRTQIVQEDLNQEIRVIENTIRSLEATINQYTNQSWQNKIRLVDSITVVPPLLFDTAAYRVKIEQHHPLIQQINQQLETSQQRLVFNDKKNSPSIGVGIDYSLVNPRVDANPLGNGRDILIPKLMITLPIYRKSYRSTIDEESLKQEMYTYEKEALSDALMRKLIDFKLSYDNAYIELKTHQRQIKTIKVAIDILITNYSSSGKGFDEVLQQENALLKHEIGLLKSFLDLHIAVANIDRLTDF